MPTRNRVGPSGCTASFAKLLGDWAITVWNPHDNVLILAKDIIGIRPLYFHPEKHKVKWSSVLDPLVVHSDQSHALNLSYVAGWLGPYPAAESTPYLGILAVPPASYVSLRPAGYSTFRYWEFDSTKQIEYRSDRDYEEHFRSVFGEAVRRRLRSDRPICADLSGGMDSSSITCMADVIAASSPSAISPIVTLSLCDSSEPNANDQPYLSTVEDRRGQRGCHIDTAGMELFSFETNRFQATPAHTTGNSALAGQKNSFLRSKGIRVLLSGTGGDETMGGVPTPLPELQDLLVKGDIRSLAHKLKLWALYKRKPWFHLLAAAMGGFFPRSLVAQSARPAPWLTTQFVKRNEHVLVSKGPRLSIWGALPSFQSNLLALDTLRRQMALSSLPSDPPHERRYPFLDRDLLEFVFAVPREQILRPGFRRSLMRRAMNGIVPPEVLERKRKSFTTRGPRVAVRAEWKCLDLLSHQMASSRFGIVDERCFQDALLAAKDGRDIPLIRLMRTIVLEAWLRGVLKHSCIRGTSS